MLLAGALVLGGPSGFAAGSERDLMSDTWAAIDSLGRTLPGKEQVRTPRADRTVVLFYFLWHYQHTFSGPHDVSRILADHPAAMNDAKHPAWGPAGAYHHWGEPLFGYYRSDDEWVFRRHAEMLADAGVDAIIFDCSNGFTYSNSYFALCRAFERARADGVAVPRIAFLCPFAPRPAEVQELYRDLYGPGRQADLWFRWQGKPFIMAWPDGVPKPIRSFFTFRAPVPSYFTGPRGADQWGWLEVFPQHAFMNAAGETEEVTVGVAQNAVGDRLTAMSEPGARGRSFHGGRTDPRPEAWRHGFNFAEQARRALELDPKAVFITGWNEWVAARLNEFNAWKAPVVFVDQFDLEHSRDIEPMRGGFGDDYYLLMTSFIRRYKGVRPAPAASAPKTIAIDGRFDDWADVGPVYLDHRGDTAHRDHPGWGEYLRYTHRTGRNDLLEARVARDASHLYFHVKTAAPITPATDSTWMRLLINVDRRRDTGWEGYDFAVNRMPPGPAGAAVERSTNGWNWTACGTAPIRVAGDALEVAIPRAALGLPAGAPMDFEFKWADNTRDGDAMDFYINGDAAPGGRFNFRYVGQ